MSNETDFDKAFAIVVGAEGVFSTDPDDPGNWTGGRKGMGIFAGTKYGISAAAYPQEDIKNLTLSRAKQLYQRDYWAAASCSFFRWPLNLALFDAAVQHDPRDAVRILQGALGLKVDGVMGPVTRAAAQKMAPDEAAVQLMRKRLDYYRSLRLWDKYATGWTNRLFRVAFAA